MKQTLLEKAEEEYNKEPEKFCEKLRYVFHENFDREAQLTFHTVKKDKAIFTVDGLMFEAVGETSSYSIRIYLINPHNKRNSGEVKNLVDIYTEYHNFVSPDNEKNKIIGCLPH